MHFKSFVSFVQGGLWLWLTAEWQRHDNESCLHLKRDSNWHRRTKSKKFKWVNMAKQIERFRVLDMSWPLFCVQFHFSRWLGHFRLCFGFLRSVSDFEFGSNVHDMFLQNTCIKNFCTPTNTVQVNNVLL